MKRFSFVPLPAALLGLVLGTAPTVLAQGGKPLDEDDIKNRLNRSEEHLEKAREAADSGRSDEARAHLEKYTENMTAVNRALAGDHVEEGDRLQAAEIVDQATLRHIPVLEDVLTRVPAQAQPAIQRALEVSLTGHDVATQAIVSGGQVDIPGFLSRGAAQDAMNKNDALLDHAQRTEKHLEVLESLRARLPAEALPGLDTAIANAQRRNQQGLDATMQRFTSNTGQVTQAIEMGRVPDFQAESVFALVNQSTRRQLPVLEELLGRVPAEAQANIQRAIQMSQRGNQAATAAVGGTPAAGRQPGPSGGRPGPGGPGGPGGGPGGGPPGDKGPPGGKGPPF